MAVEILKDTSSIGPQWPPMESSFNRIKGINNTGVIRDTNKFYDTVTEVKSILERQMGSAGKDGMIDRLSVRLIVENDIWYENISLLEDLGEVIIPLEGASRQFENSSIIYLGKNSSTRCSDEGDLNNAISNVNIAVQQSAVSYSQAIDRATRQGFTLEILDTSKRMLDSNLHDQITNLYRRFGWEKTEVLDILSKPLNVIAVARDGNQIVSAGIGEINAIRLGDGSCLRIVEITEAATAEGYQKKGLYSSVASKLMVELAHMSKSYAVDGGPIDLVFGECNGNEQGVLKAVKSLGRTFSYEVVKRGGLPFKGYLPQHVPIAGAPRKTQYNDLFPAFITNKKLLSLADK